MIVMMSKACREDNIVVRVRKKVVGDSNGQTTERKVRRREAPSRAAASSRSRKVHSPQNRGEDAGDGVEDEHPHHADTHTGKDVRCEDDGSGDVTSHQLTVEDDGQPEADEHGESDGGDGEDEGRRQDSARVASEELDVVLQPNPSGIGRTEGPVESRVVDVQEERSVDE